MNELPTNNETHQDVQQPIADSEIEAMLKAGLHLGHAKTKTHPSMQPYIYCIRNTIAIIDLVKTKEKFASAVTFLKDVAVRKGLVLFVGTRPAARKIVREVAEKTKMPFFTERWIGGTLTNFTVISGRVAYMEKIEKEKESGEFEKYTKKERMKKEEEIIRLRRFFDGLRRLSRLPDAVVIVDTTHDTTAVREARRMKIPIVAPVDTNANYEIIDYPIPANDDALPAVRYTVGRMGDAIEEGQRDTGVQQQEAQQQ